MKKKLLVPAVTAVILGGIVAAYFVTSTQSQTKDEVPTISIDKLNSDSLKDGELRTERGKKYSEHAPKIEDNGLSGELSVLPLSHAPYKRAFPTVVSDALANGTLTRA